jgi:hypothetical protein
MLDWEPPIEILQMAKAAALCLVGEILREVGRGRSKPDERAEKLMRHAKKSECRRDLLEAFNAQIVLTLCAQTTIVQAIPVQKAIPRQRHSRLTEKLC